MEYLDWKELSEILKNIVTTGAIIIGGLWSYRKFFKEAEHESSITVEMNCKVVDTENPKLRLLTIRAKLSNNGKTPSQIIIDKSHILIYQINAEEQSHKLYLECNYHKQLGTFNIPVSGSMEVLDFALIEHPGIYHINAFFAQSLKDERKFFKRMKKVYKDTEEKYDYSGWFSERIISSEYKNNHNEQA